MIDQKQAIDIYKQFSNEVLGDEQWYKDIHDYILATLLYGSVAKGTNREDSDIDILIIVPLVIEEKYTSGEYTYTYDNNEINIVLRSVEKLEAIAIEHKDTFQKEIFRNAVIISSNDEVIGLLKSISNIEE